MPSIEREIEHLKHLEEELHRLLSAEDCHMKTTREHVEIYNQLDLSA